MPCYFINLLPTSLLYISILLIRDRHYRWTHAVALEDGGKDVVFLIETQIVPIVVVMDRKRGQLCVNAGVSQTQVSAKAHAERERENRMIAFCTLSSVIVWQSSTWARSSL